jgi:fibronectin-binding autotransporter adhesin
MLSMAKALSIRNLSVSVLLFISSLSFQSLGQNVYSGATGNYDAIQWYLDAGRTIPFVGTPGALQTLNIGNGHNVTILNGTVATFAGIVVHDAGASGTFTYGSTNNAASTLTVTGDIVVNSAGSFVVGGNNVGGNLHTLNIGGSLTNNNIFNMYFAVNDRANVVFNSGATQTIGGTGTTTFFGVTFNGSNVNVNNSFTVLNQLTFGANLLLILNSTSNVTMGSGATITGASSSRYFQLDGSTSSGSQLVITNNGTTAAWQILYPIGTAAAGYTPLDLTAANGAVVTTAPTANSTLAVKTIQNASIQGQMRRQFRLLVSGNAAATTFQNADFYYNSGTDLSSGDVIGNYTTNWYLSVANGTWQAITGTAPGAGFFTAPGTAQTLGNGTYYYAIGSSTAFTNIWYSYQTGVWSEPDVWTLDPSGTSLNNPLNQPPSAGDQVVILNGFTVTVDAAAGALTLSTTTIQGGAILDMSNTSGHTLGTVSGQGLLRMNGVALPTGNYAAFVAATGGTIEYYNTGGNLSTSQTTYNKLKFTNSTASNITYVQRNNITVNGTFDLSTTGSGTVTWQINDASNTQRTIVLNDDLTVSAGGRIRVGTGNEDTPTPHNLTMYGNIINNGSIKFYDDTDTELSETDYGLTYPTTGVDLHRNEIQGNAVTVTFAGTTNRTVTCNNTTDFYRLVLNKGTGQTNILTISSANTAYFRLFGPANIAVTESGNSWEFISANALSLINGTLELTGSIDIPVLTVNTSGTGYFPIPRNAALWLNGNDVTVQITDNSPAVYSSTKDGRILMSGLLRITAGTLNDGFSKGLGSQDGGTYFQEGGTVNCWQFRPRASGTGIFSFIQTGGTLNVGYGYALSGGKIDSFEEDYMRFDLNSPNSTFQMSGTAVLNVAKPTNTGEGTGGLFLVASSSENFNVTGGTINLYAGPETATGSYTAFINTTAPLYNVNIYKEAATTATIQLQTNNLVVLGNLTIGTGNDPSFITNNLNVTVGGNFDVQASTTYTPGTGTTTFNGSGPQTWTNNGTITALSNVVIAKTTGSVLTLAGANTLPNITGALTLTSGTLDDGGKAVTLSGTAVLTNNAIHTGTGSIIYASTAGTMLGAEGTFGNFTLNTNATLSTSGDQTVTGTLRLVSASSTLNIGANALTVLGNIYSVASGTNTSFTATKRIQTNGVHNAGGLTRQGGAGDLLFPVGTGTLYTPVFINVVATTHGTITVRPVASEHPNVTTTAQSVRYYWRVTSSGYSGITSVIHKNYNYSTATEDNPTANYRSARFDRTALSWATNNSVFNATASPPIPNFNTGTGWTGVTGDQLDGEYTAGNIAAFGAVTVYYSRASGAWNVNATWSTSTALKHSGPAAASNPTSCPTCPVVIGDGSTFNHTITTVAASSCGSLTLSSGSVLDCGTFTGHNFGTSTGGAVSGTGTLRIAAIGAGVANMFPAGDFTNFLGPDGGTVEWYGATKTIPATGPAPYNLSLATYHNLIINPNSANTITLPASNLTIYNDLTEGSAAGFTGTTVTNGSRTISISRDLTISRGTFSFSNANPSVTTLSVNGTTTIANGATMSAAAGGTANVNTLTTPGSIINNGTLDFKNTALVNITFNGTDNVTLSGTGATTDLNLVTVNKGTSQTAVVNCTASGLTATTSGWLTITNGTFHWNNTATVTISTASATYSIPATGKLQVSQGTVTILSANSGTADLRLSGALEVSGGTVNVGTPANAIDNDIEYSSAGFPNIIVSAGSLNVNGSIRRSTSTITGSLIYDQSGGTVLVQGESSNNTRGVFEIDANPGSSFTLTGTSSLIIERQTGGTVYADLFLNPSTSNVSATSTISVGRTTANTQTNIRVTVAPTIGNFTIRNGAGTNAQTVNMFSNPMVLAGTLTIESPSVLVTNSLDVTIAGDLNITGTGIYTGGTNTTTFNGTGAQAGALSAGSTFTNMTINKTAGTTLTLSGTSPTITNLNILSGILNVGALNLTVTGDIVNNSSQTGTGTIQMAGAAGITTHTITSSGGSFTNLTLAGSATTKTVTVEGNMSILGTLNFASANRYLNIGSGELTFGTASSVTNAGNTAFVKTNGSDSDLGVVKSWAAGAGTFTYPIGTTTNYTPVTFTLNVTTPGTISVIPVNDRHPTAFPSGEQILNYYWIVNRGSIVYTATGSHVYGYPTALLGGSGGTLRAAYLDIASTTPGWTTTGHGGTATTTAMTYTNLLTTNLPATGNTFHYSVGTNTTSTATLPNPIVPVYSRLADANVAASGVGGDWNNTNSWTLQSDGMGAPWGSIPFGNSVVILNGARINITQSGRKTFINRIDGLLVLPSDKVGHSFGILRGTGTMRTTTNTFPAGNYTAFVAAGGGTIEYVAPMTMNNRTTYNNLSVIGTGAVTMTNTDLTLNGNVNIGTGATLSNTTNNRNMTVAGGWTTATGGSFAAGTGTVTFNGTTAGSINGTTTFNNVTVSKTGANITLAGTGTTTVNNLFTLTSGHLITSATHLLSLPLAASISGGSASSYISGPARKVLAAGGTLNLPLGSVSANRYRPAILSNTTATDTWTFEYVGDDPSNGGYNELSFNTANIQKVSMFEYWLISRAGATAADVTLTYNTGSYIPNPTNIGNVANLRVVRWDGTQWDLPPGGGTHSQAGSNVTGTVMVTNVTNFSPLTFGSLDADSPLPVKWGPFEARWAGDAVAIRWVTVQEINNDHFEIERSEDGIEFHTIGLQAGHGNSSVQNQYRHFDSEASKSRYHYYRIKQVDYDGKFEYSRVVVVAPIGEGGRFWVTYPNPLKQENTFILEQSETSSKDASVDVILYSSQGVQVYQASGSIGEISKMLNSKLHTSGSGVYLLKVSNGLITETFKIVRH